MDLRAVFERQRAVHIGFGGGEFRIEEQLEIEFAVAQVNADIRPRLDAAEGVHAAIGVAHPQGAEADEAPQQARQ